jgi:hypothetical protein
VKAVLEQIRDIRHRLFHLAAPRSVAAIATHYLVFDAKKHCLDFMMTPTIMQRKMTSFRRALRIRAGQLKVILEQERMNDQRNHHSSNKMNENQKKKKTVRFCRNVQTRPIPPLSDLSSQEKQARWYTCREYLRMAKRKEQLHEAIVYYSSVISGGVLVTIGLESIEDRMMRRFRVSMGQLCVLIKQEHHWNQGHTDYVGGSVLRVSDFKT